MIVNSPDDASLRSERALHGRRTMRYEILPIKEAIATRFCQMGIFGEQHRRRTLMQSPFFHSCSTMQLLKTSRMKPKAHAPSDTSGLVLLNVAAWRKPILAPRPSFCTIKPNRGAKHTPRWFKASSNITDVVTSLGGLLFDDGRGYVTIWSFIIVALIILGDRYILNEFGKQIDASFDRLITTQIQRRR